MFVCLSICASSVVAQSDCETEEPPYPEFFGVYPTPQNDTLPDGTIFFSDGLPSACQGEPYVFDLTVIMPDSIFAGDFLPLFSFYVDVEQAILTNPNSIGLPAGFSFETSATDWTILGGVVECVRITGSSTELGEYPLTFSLLASSPDIPFDVPVDFDGYVLRVVADNEECITSITETPSLTFSDSYNFPNPFQDQTVLHLTSKQKTSLTLTIFDILGKKVHERSLEAQMGKNEWTIYTRSLSLQSGVYVYTLGNGVDVVGGKMVVE